MVLCLVLDFFSFDVGQVLAHYSGSLFQFLIKLSFLSLQILEDFFFACSSSLFATILDFAFFRLVALVEGIVDDLSLCMSVFSSKRPLDTLTGQIAVNSSDFHLSMLLRFRASNSTHANIFDGKPLRYSSSDGQERVVLFTTKLHLLFGLNGDPPDIIVSHFIPEIDFWLLLFFAFTQVYSIPLKHKFIFALYDEVLRYLDQVGLVATTI